MERFMSPNFSDVLNGFRTKHSTECSLLICLFGSGFYKNFQSKMKFGAIFVDLSNACDMINHSLLIAKLSAYGF